MPSEDDEDEIFQRPVPPKGKLYRGVVLQHARTPSTIPSKAELTPPPPTHARSPEKESSRSRRTAVNFVGEGRSTPGPGAYATPSYEASPPPSISRKGMGNGFASTTQRFPIAAPAVTRAPGPGQYYDESKQSSINISPPRPTPEPTESLAQTKPTPGPGFYDPHDPNYPPANPRGTAQFLDSSKRTKFIPDQDASSQRMGPGRYDPKTPEAAPGVVAPFVSHTKRELPYGNTNTPGPGAYIDEENKEKPEKPHIKPRTQGKLMSTSLVHISSSMMSRANEKKNTPATPPGPGDYLQTHGKDIKTQEVPHHPSPLAPPRIRSRSVPVQHGSSFASRTERTKTNPPATHTNVGPGAYNTTSSTIIKTSFNANRHDSWVA